MQKSHELAQMFVTVSLRLIVTTQLSNLNSRDNF